MNLHFLNTQIRDTYDMSADVDGMILLPGSEPVARTLAHQHQATFLDGIILARMIEQQADRALRQIRPNS
ncbi:MAG TPA: hypothetical protein VHZ07_09245 [Bryobacteraceae bacterium]|nr:hypothetical protein [Bryobacteraceae bacterium]